MAVCLNNNMGEVRDDVIKMVSDIAVGIDIKDEYCADRVTLRTGKTP